MPKKELKILEFHGGSNTKFDARDIADNQNAYSWFSVRKPGRLCCEGSGHDLQSGTNLNPHAITDISAATGGGFQKTYGLYSFSHDFDMDNQNVIQDGTAVDVDGDNWARKNDAGAEDGWTDANPAAFEDDDTASLINTLGGDGLKAGRTYRLSFDVGVASISMYIGAGDASGTSNLPQEALTPSASYEVGSHNVIFTVGTSDRSHLWFTATGSGNDHLATLDNISCYRHSYKQATDFIAINDANDIDIYDPKADTPGWDDAKIKLGGRKTEVKPTYYYVDGALRVCDANFDRIQADAGKDNELEAAMSTTDLSIYIDDGSSGTVTYAVGDLIQVNDEIMYMTSGGTAADFTVIRGFAGTPIQSHAINDKVYFVNLPKYFGHINQTRFMQCGTRNTVSTWVEDVGTPQRPNNTRKTTGVNTTLSNTTAGEQSLRVLDVIESATEGYPTETEKVVLEFKEGEPNFGIAKVQVGTAMTDNSPTRLKLYTSGYREDYSALHGLSVGDEIDIAQSPLSYLNGKHEVVGDGGGNLYFEIDVDGVAGTVDEVLQANAYEAPASWTDYKDTVPNTVKLTLADTGTGGGASDGTSLPSMASAGSFWVHVAGVTGTTSYNGVKNVTRVSGTEIYFTDAEHDGASSASTAGARVHELFGLVVKEEGKAIDDDLKRKWNFGMSFTYDGPGKEYQESLLTKGYKITPSTVSSDGTSNELAEDMGDTTTEAEHNVDDASVFTANETVIMIGTEQMLVTGVDTGGTPHIDVKRGYNGSEASTHSSGDQIFIVEEFSQLATVDWTSKVAAPLATIKFINNFGVKDKGWHPRINGFKIYMKEVTESSDNKEWRMFAKVDFVSGTYQMTAAGDAELVLSQPGTYATDGKLCTYPSGTQINVKPVDTYLSENLFTEDTHIDAQYKHAELVGRRLYIGNIKQNGRTYPDRMLRTPINKFDTFPETNYIDVAVGDGDDITALKSFGDRLLQFKKNKVYIINTGGEQDVLEAEYNNAGISRPSQVCKTNTGLAWINTYGLWLLQGEEVINVTREIKDGGFGDDSVYTFQIGFDSYSNRLIFTPSISAGNLTLWYIYDLNLMAYQHYRDGTLFPVCTKSGEDSNYYTNFVNIHSDLIFGYVSGDDLDKVNIHKWSNTSKGGGPTTATSLWTSKDYDFGSPSTRKKVYKIYVTYKCTGHSGVKLEYGTDGSSTQTGTFDDYPSNGSIYNRDFGGFRNTSGEWEVAELKPSSSINNIKTLQLSLKTTALAYGQCAGTGDPNELQLATDVQADYYYNDFNIYIYDGPSKWNNKLISDYDATGATTIDRIFVSSNWSDYGHSTTPTSASHYVLGSIPDNFEINDITVIYREKPIK